MSPFSFTDYSPQSAKSTQSKAPSPSFGLSVTITYGRLVHGKANGDGELACLIVFSVW